MPEVTVKLAREKVFPLEKREDFNPYLQKVIADVLSMKGTQAELRPEEIEVDYVVAGPGSCMNGLAMIIKIEANQYPERAGRAQEMSNRLKVLLSQSIFFPDLPNHRWNVWVRLAEGGWS